MMAAPSEGCSLWRGWVGLCSRINRFFENSFFKWSGFVFVNPWKVIVVSLLIALGLMAGFARFNTQTQSERLYFPEHSQSKDDLERAAKSFPAKARNDEFIITMADGAASILNRKPFELALKLHKRIMNETGIEMICVPSDPLKTDGHPCLFSNVLHLFQYNSTLVTDQNITPILLGALKNKHILFPNGRPAVVELENLLGDFQYDRQSDAISATALRALYTFKFPETDSFHKVVSDVQKKIGDVLLEGRAEAERDGMKLYLLTGRSTDESISESSGGDISLVAASIALMCTFSTVVLVGLRDHVSGHVTAGFAGIGCIALGIGSGFGLVMLTGQYFVAFVGTLPFLVLGVGIDDMFIILDALDSLPSEIMGKARLQRTMAKVGASVTMTTITDIMAFAISSSTDFPAIRYFCYYALTTILLAYVLLMTVFLAALALDIQRIENSRWDWLCCVRKESYSPWTKYQSTISKKVMNKWGNFLMLNHVRAIVVILSLGLLGVGIYGSTKLDESFDVRQLAPDGSYLIDFLDTQERYFPTGFAVSVINDNTAFDYTDHALQQDYVQLSALCKQNPYMKNWTNNWLESFINSNAYQNNTNNMTFYDKMTVFLSENPTYRADLKFSTETGRVVYSRITCLDKDTTDWTFRKNAMLTLRDDFAKKSKISSSVFTASMSYLYREQMVAVPRETIMNLVLCGVAILIITTPYLVHPLVILIVFGGFVALVFELFALMVVWGVALNSISMITSIMAIGFAVDYSAHVAHSYLLAGAATPEQRMIEALGSIGASVFMGGFTTFLGILVLVFGKSEIFRIFFKMVFGIVALGLLNGLLFLPVFLSLLVRNKINIEHIMLENNNDQVGKNTEPRSSFSMQSGNRVDDAVVIRNPGSPEK